MDSRLPRIPVIDIGNINQGTGSGINSIVRQFIAAYSTTGFAYIVNHGIDQQLVRDLFQQSARFHSLPHSQKLQIELNQLHRGFIPINTSTDRNSKLAVVTRPNQSESFIMMREAEKNDPGVLAGDFLAGANQWPSQLDGFRETVCAYHDELSELGLNICRVIALALGTCVETFTSLFEPPTTFLRLLHYPPQAPDPSGDLYGSAPHTDFGCITLLAQDEVGGLQIRSSEGDWIDAPCIPNAFVLNIGDMLHRWSNGRLLSTPHRVINRPGRERFSCAFFFDPDVNVEVSPLASCVTPDNPARFNSIRYGAFLRRELSMGYDKHAGNDPG